MDKCVKGVKKYQEFNNNRGVTKCKNLEKTYKLA